MQSAFGRRVGGAAAMLLLALDACTSPSQEAAAPESGAAPAHHAASCQRLFVSPAGEPFRRAEGGPCPLEVWFAGAGGHRHRS